MIGVLPSTPRGIGVYRNRVKIYRSGSSSGRRMWKSFNVELFQMDVMFDTHTKTTPYTAK